MSINSFKDRVLPNGMSQFQKNCEAALLGVGTLDEDILIAAACEFGGFIGGPEVDFDLAPLIDGMRRGVVDIDEHIIPRMYDWSFDFEVGCCKRVTDWEKDHCSRTYSEAGMAPESYELLTYLARRTGCVIEALEGRAFGSACFDDLNSLRVFVEDWGLYHDGEVVYCKMDSLRHITSASCPISPFMEGGTSSFHGDVVSVIPYVKGHQVIRLQFMDYDGTSFFNYAAYYDDSLSRYRLVEVDRLLPAGCFVLNGILYGTKAHDFPVLFDKVPIDSRPFDNVAPSSSVISLVQCPVATSLLLYTTVGEVELETSLFVPEENIRTIEHALPENDDYRRISLTDQRRKMNVPWDITLIPKSSIDDVSPYLNTAIYSDLPIMEYPHMSGRAVLTREDDCLCTSDSVVYGVPNRKVEVLSEKDCRLVFHEEDDNARRWVAIKRMWDKLCMGLAWRRSPSVKPGFRPILEIRSLLEVCARSGHSVDLGNFSADLGFLGFVVAHNYVYVNFHEGFDLIHYDQWPSHLFKTRDKIATYHQFDDFEYTDNVSVQLCAAAVRPFVCSLSDGSTYDLWWRGIDRQGQNLFARIVFSKVFDFISRGMRREDESIIHALMTTELKIDGGVSFYPPIFDWSGTMLTSQGCSRALKYRRFYGPRVYEMREEMIQDEEELGEDEESEFRIENGEPLWVAWFQ